MEKPSEFAALLLGDKSKWNLEKLEKEIGAGKTRTIFLPDKIPVMFLYITVVVKQKEFICFRDDIYGRDAAVIKGLDAPFEFKNLADNFSANIKQLLR